MKANEIVDILLEDEADEFVTSLPDEFWDTFHVIADGENGVGAEHGYRQHHLVYKNSADGTRDFIGYIVQASNGKWSPSGVARPRPGQSTAVDKLDYKSVPYFGSQERAVRHLMMIYRQRNG
jgi:hypothetical protein